MGQDWKTLTVVVLAAAMLGWLVVRMIGGSAGTEPPAPAVATPPPPAPSPADRAAAAPTAAPVAPRATAAAMEAPASDAADVDVIVRDLEVIAQALVRDQRIEDRVIPRIDDALDVPGVTEYRRAPDFWDPALAGSGGADR